MEVNQIIHQYQNVFYSLILFLCMLSYCWIIYFDDFIKILYAENQFHLYFLYENLVNILIIDLKNSIRFCLVINNYSIINMDDPNYHH